MTPATLDLIREHERSASARVPWVDTLLDIIDLPETLPDQKGHDA